MNLNKEELWHQYVDKNPQFLTGPINFTPGGLRKFFDQTFDVAERLGKPDKKDNKNNIASIFSDIFKS